MCTPTDFPVAQRALPDAPRFLRELRQAETSESFQPFA